MAETSSTYSLQNGIENADCATVWFDYNRYYGAIGKFAGLISWFLYGKQIVTSLNTGAPHASLCILPFPPSCFSCSSLHTCPLLFLAS
jgi:hypothetical protein